MTSLKGVTRKKSGSAGGIGFGETYMLPERENDRTGEGLIPVTLPLAEPTAESKGCQKLGSERDNTNHYK